jgi:fructokinase
MNLPRPVIFGEALTDVIRDNDNQWRSISDTVECGDACVGSWMASILMRPQAGATVHLRFSAACAVVVATRAGAYAPTAAEISTMIDSPNTTTRLGQ